MRANLTDVLIISLILTIMPSYAAPGKDVKKTPKSEKSKSTKSTKNKKKNIPTQKTPKGFNEALVFQSMMIYDKAIPKYQKALQDDPKFVSTYNNLAQCLYKRNRKNDRKAARAYLNQAVKLEPKNVGSLHTKALLDTADKKYDSAEESYRKILKIQPLNFRAVQNLSELLFKIGKRKEAREVLITVIKKDPPKEHKKVYQQALKNLDKKIKERSQKKTG